MADIFGKAQRVIVFLDEEADSSALAIKTLKRITTPLSKELQQTLGNYPEGAAFKRTLSLDESRRLISDSEQTALRAFFNRPWFSRLWVRKVEVQNSILPILRPTSVSDCRTGGPLNGNSNHDRLRTGLHTYHNFLSYPILS